MIKVRFATGKNESADRQFDIVAGELLSDAVSRSVDGIPLGDKKPGDVFRAIVNGNFIDNDFWEITALRPTDNLLVCPRLMGNPNDRMFGQALVIAATIIAAVYAPELVGAGAPAAFFTAAVSIGGTLLVNALIPPPTIGGLDLSLAGNIASSQMYSLTGQSNQVKQFQPVPKVYGRHRVFPNVAANPYTQLELDPITGKQVEYLYVVYDFGFGPMTIDSLMIGDTPLTKGNFADFDYKLVDFNKPTDEFFAEQAVLAQVPGNDIAVDGNNTPWNGPLLTSLVHYKGKSSGDSFSIELDGNESVVGTDASQWQAFRNTAVNETNSPQKIILTFVNPALYSFATNGAMGWRQIDMQIHFRKVGTDPYREWIAYNDQNFCAEPTVTVGGLDASDLVLTLAGINSPATIFGDNVSIEDNPFYIFQRTDFFEPADASPFYGSQYLKADQPKLFMKTFQSNQVVVSANQLVIGREVYYRGTEFLGKVLSVDLWPHDPAYTVVTLDRNIAALSGSGFNWFGRLPAINYIGHFTAPESWSELAGDKGTITSTQQGLGAFRIKGSEQTAHYSSVTFSPTERAQFEIKVERIITTGQYPYQTADALAWTSVVTRFDTTPIKTDKRHVFLDLRIRASNQLNGTITDFSGVCKSAIDVWDGTQWTKAQSNNPAWVFADLMTSEVSKKPIPKSRLHLPSLLEWANFCDEVPPSPPTRTYFKKRFQTNFVLDYATTLQAVLGQVASAAQAGPTLIDGKYGVFIDRLQETPVQVFTPRNSTNFTSSRIYGPRPPGIRVKYINPFGFVPIETPRTFIDAAVNITTNAITIIAHGLNTGRQVAITTDGFLPEGLTATKYWVIRIDQNTVKLAATAADSLLLMEVDITSATGGGHHSLLPESLTDSEVGWKVSEIIAYDAGYAKFGVTAATAAIEVDLSGTPASGGVAFLLNGNLTPTIDLSGGMSGAAALVQAAMRTVPGFEQVIVERLGPFNVLDVTFTGVAGPVVMEATNNTLLTFASAPITVGFGDITVGVVGVLAADGALIEDMTSFACTNDEQAWRFGRFMLAQNKLRQETMSIQVDFEQLVCTRGDFVQITQDVMRVGGTPARVKSVVGTVVTINDALDLSAARTQTLTRQNGTPTSGDYVLNFNVEVQFWTLDYDIDNSSPVSGYIKFAYNGEITSAIAFRDDGFINDVAINDVQPALRALTGLGAVDVIGDFYNGFEIIFSGTSGPAPHQITVNDGSLFNSDGVALNSSTSKAFTGIAGSGSTAPIAFDATAADVQAALRLLAGLSLVTVTGDASEYTVNFVGVNGAINKLFLSLNTLDPVADYSVARVQNFGVTFRAASGDIKTSALSVVSSHSFSLDSDLPATGDLIIVGEVGKLVFDCLVKSIAPNDDLSATLMLIEKADAIYTSESTGNIPAYSPQLSSVVPQEFQAPGAVQNLTATGAVDNNGDAYGYFLQVVWTPPANSPSGTLYEIIVDPLPITTGGKGDIGWVTTTPSTTLTYAKVALAPSQVDVPLTVTVVAKDTSTGLSLPPALATNTTVTVASKTTPPSDVLSLDMSIVGTILQLSWPKLPDLDIATFSIRYSPNLTATWGTSTPLLTVDGKSTTASVQGRTGSYFIKAVDLAGNESTNAAEAITTIPQLFNLNIVEEIPEIGFLGRFDRTERTTLPAVILSYSNIAAKAFYSEGYYYYAEQLDLGEVFTVNLESRVKAAGYTAGTVMSSWETLSSVSLLNETSTSTKWNVEAQYRAVGAGFHPISDWLAMSDIPIIDEGGTSAFTEWRTFTRGSATGQLFQFRLRLTSLAANVSPAVFDGLIIADMPDRQESYENLTATIADGYALTYSVPFKGPAPSPNVQVSIDNAEAGDFWVFDYKTVDGFLIRFYNLYSEPVERTFDVAVKGYGHNYTVAI